MSYLVYYISYFKTEDQWYIEAISAHGYQSKIIHRTLVWYD